MTLLDKLKKFEHLIGNSPLFELNSDFNLYAKLEFNNLMGSIKDRPALYIIRKAILANLINENTTVIESTSGNFGIALAGICKSLDIKFIPVIDPNITPANENLLERLAYKVIKVTERDESGGFLLNRIKKVKELMLEIPEAYNPNQYENEDNYMAYYNTLAEEICHTMPKLDYAFISVSSGGTVTGVSLRLKEHFPGIKIVAVDIEGSLVFQDIPKARKLSGMGSSLRTKIINKALIDEVVILSQRDIIKGCRSLLKEQAVFGGASSGAAYFAANKVLSELSDKNVHALIICPDKGITYSDSVYNDEWVSTYIN